MKKWWIDWGQHIVAAIFMVGIIIELLIVAVLLE